MIRSGNKTGDKIFEMTNIVGAYTTVAHTAPFARLSVIGRCQTFNCIYLQVVRKNKWIFTTTIRRPYTIIMCTL